MNLKDPSNIFFTLLFSFCAGIFVGALFSISLSFFIITFLCAGIVLSIHTFLKGQHALVLSLLVLFGMTLGGIRLEMSISSFSTHAPSHTLVGIVQSNPVDTTYGQSFIFLTNQREKVLVKNRGRVQSVYNDTLTLEATCTEPKNFQTDLGSTFDYVTYLKKDHIYFVCDAQNVSVMSHQKSFIQTLYRFSNMMSDQIASVFKSPHDAFTGGVLVGDKTHISNETRNDFIKTGTIHILALSGYNIAIIALFFQYLFVRLMKKKVALVLSGLSVLLFIAMTGFMASAIRAGIMALVALGAQFHYQKYSALRALFFASCVMVLFDPFYLLYDSSFHLSFLATFGVVALSPIIDVYLGKIKNNTLRATCATTLGAYIMTFPYLACFFQGLSLVGIVANILILPLIPLLMCMSTVALVMSFILFPLSFVPSILTEYLSALILKMVHLFALVPLGYVSTHTSLLVCSILYIGILWGMYWFKKKI